MSKIELIELTTFSRDKVRTIECCDKKKKCCKKYKSKGYPCNKCPKFD